jgi:hypothetical protein
MTKDRIYLLWCKDLGFCPGFAYHTQKEMKKAAERAFKKPWKECRWSGLSIIKIEGTDEKVLL